MNHNEGRLVQGVRVYDFIPPPGRYVRADEMPEHPENIEMRVQRHDETALVQRVKVRYDVDPPAANWPDAFFTVWLEGKYVGQGRSIEEGLARIERARAETAG